MSWSVPKNTEGVTKNMQYCEGITTSSLIKESKSGSCTSLEVTLATYMNTLNILDEILTEFDEAISSELNC